MKIHRGTISILGLLTLLIFPGGAFASGSASVGALDPGVTVLVGAHVTFSVIPSGFTNPTYTVIDSFGGGANDQNIDSIGNFSWTPNNSDIGSHTITVTVNDSLGDNTSVSQTVTVVSPSVSIGSVSPSATVQYGTPVTFTLSSTGYMNPQYSVADSFGYSSIISANTNGTTGVFYWTPLFQDIGTHTLVATVRDYLGNNVASASQVITVTPPSSVNIVSVAPGTTLSVGEPVTIVATTTGFIEPVFTVKDDFTATLGTSTLSVDQSGNVTWTPVPNDIGVHHITISATDASGHAGSVTATLTVTPAGPVAYTPASPVRANNPMEVLNSSQSSQTTSSFYVFRNYLAFGSSGKDVIALQKLLQQLGIYHGPVTGYFGPLTRVGVLLYQKDHDISQVGVVGPLTRTRLNTGA